MVVDVVVVEVLVGEMVVLVVVVVDKIKATISIFSTTTIPMPQIQPCMQKEKLSES